MRERDVTLLLIQRSLDDHHALSDVLCGFSEHVTHSLAGWDARRDGAATSAALVGWIIAA